MPLNLQARLLRVLQEKEIWRLGSDRSIKVDVRVIASTNDNLFEMVKRGDFRRDLYFRLNVLKLEPMPLRERKDDIELIFNYYINKYSKTHISIDEELMHKIKDYVWPGNVRELQNFVERVCLLNGYVPVKRVFEQLVEGNVNSPRDHIDEDSILIKKGTKDEMEKQIINKLYAENNYNATLLADKLGISRTTVWKKLNK